MNKLFYGDCIDILPTLPDKSIDFIFCDLPFQVTANSWDQILPLDFLWKEFSRIGKKNTVTALFAVQPFITDVINSNRKNYKYSWYWKKNQGTNFFHAKRMPIRVIEEILIFGKGSYFPQITSDHTPTNSAKGKSIGKTYFGTNIRNDDGGKTTRYPNNFLEFKCVDNYSRQHSSQKPTDLCRYIIQTYTEPNQVVLDITMGVGSIPLAASEVGWRYIGIEKNINFYNIATERICGS